MVLQKRNVSFSVAILFFPNIFEQENADHSFSVCILDHEKLGVEKIE